MVTTTDHNSSRELFFLYELAKVFASSIDVAEVTECVLDGTCALLGTEQGFVCFLDAGGALQPHACRGLTPDDLRLLSGCLQVAVQERRLVDAPHPHSEIGALLAAPLVAHDRVQGLVGVATAYERVFTRQEQERLSSVANLASLAMDNARLYERVQRELALLKHLIRAAQSMEAGQLSVQEAAELAKMEGWDELSHLGKAFGQMAQQVIRREEHLRQQVAELRIQIDEAKRARQVAEITETDYFQQLQKKAAKMRVRRG